MKTVTYADSLLKNDCTASSKRGPQKNVLLICRGSALFLVFLLLLSLLFFVTVCLFGLLFLGGGLRRKLIWLPPHLFSVFNLFSDTLHYAQTADLAVQVVKGIQHFPLNTDRLEGTIDIWWIMNILAEFKLEKRHNRGL